MSKNKIRDQLENIPDEKLQKPTKKDHMQELCDNVKEEYGIEVEPKKNVKYRIERVINFMNQHYDFRYNIINTDTEYKTKNEKHYRYFDDKDFRSLFVNLKKNNIQISDQDFKAVVYGEEISERYDPFKSYFNGLPKWDGETDYIKEYASQVYLTNEEHREFFVKGFKKWFVAMVVGLLEDEPSLYNINQTCLVLVGAQGKYKTTWIKNIIPKEMQLKYFYGGSFLVHNKDHEKYLAYKMIINLDEMAAMFKSDIESVKSKITQDQIVVRLPYGKADTHLKRRASFTATQNNIEFLKDDTGSRRWLVIEVDNICIDDNFNTAGMYAQGFELYKRGEQYWFDADDIKKIEAHNEAYQLKNFEFELVQKYYSIPKDGEIKFGIDVQYKSATDIADNLVSIDKIQININNTVIKNIGSALKRLGFKKVSRRLNENQSPVKLWCVKKILQSNDYPVSSGGTASEIGPVI